jgi:hypothetical protein
MGLPAALPVGLRLHVLRLQGRDVRVRNTARHVRQSAGGYDGGLCAGVSEAELEPGRGLLCFFLLYIGVCSMATCGRIRGGFAVIVR